MKKILFTIAILSICAASAMAQNASEQSMAVSATKTNPFYDFIVSDDGMKQPIFEVAYRAMKDTPFAVNITGIAAHFLIETGYYVGKTNSNVITNHGSHAAFGINKSFHKDKVFLSVAGGLEYATATMETKYGNVRNYSSNSNFGLFLFPRVGAADLLTWGKTRLGVVVGYRWDFAKFKFSKEYTSDNFTVGVIIH